MVFGVNKLFFEMEHVAHDGFGATPKFVLAELMFNERVSDKKVLLFLLL